MQEYFLNSHRLIFSERFQFGTSFAAKIEIVVIESTLTE
jgi:hypothetical protein